MILVFVKFQVTVFPGLVLFGEKSDEFADLLHGDLGGFADFALLHFENHESVEGSEAGLEFAKFVLAFASAEFYDIWEGRVEAGGVDGVVTIFE